VRHRQLLRALALLLASAGAAEAQTRPITGTVVDSTTSQPVGYGQVYVRGATVGAQIKDDGSFTLLVPAGDVTLGIRSIGYKRAELFVPASQSTVRFALEKDFFQLETQVITGQATGIERKNLATAISSVDAENLVKTSTPSIEASLQGKVPGGTFLANSGAPGGGMRVQLRGTTTIIGQNSPLYVVDGLVVSDVAIAPGTNPVTKASGSALDAGSQESPVNRIADLNPNDIETIEVLKGAAASAIYGSKASNGVILITTKRGRSGAPQFAITQRVGVPQLSFRNGYRYFKTLADATSAFGANAANFWKEGYTPHNLEDEIYDNSPVGYETIASANGGNDNTRYFVSGNVKHEGGVVMNTYADKQSLRLNLDQIVNSRLSLGISENVVRTAADRGLFGNDNSATSLGEVVNNVPNFIDLRAKCPDGSRKAKCDGGVYPVNPFQASNPLQTAAMAKVPETVWRNIATGKAELDVVRGAHHTLRVLGNGGADFFNQKDNVSSPPDLQYEPVDGLLGTYALAYSQNINYNLNANAVYEFAPGGGLFKATTSVGVQKESRELSTSRSVGQNLLGGVLSLATATNFILGEVHTRTDDFGLFAQQELLTLRERLFLTAGIRADRSSNDGDPAKFFYYPKFSASYRVPGLPKQVEELKLRAALGESGNQPLYGQKFTALNAGNQDGFGGFQISGAAGASDLKPERQREIEVGVDATGLASRANLELTWFEKRITDLLLNRTLPSSSGYSSERFNGGVLRTRGLEAALDLVPVRLRSLTWDTRFTFARNRSQIMELPVASFQVGGSFQRGSNIIQVGHSPTELFGNDTMPGAAAGNIQITVVPIGDQTPRYTLGMSNDVTWRGLSFYALLDRRKGTLLAAGTLRRAVQAKNSPDYDVVTKSGQKLGDVQLLYNPSVTRVFVDDASFVKLREARVSWDVPKSIASRMPGGSRSLRLSASGRNLWQRTPYRGGDPEVSNFGFSDALGGVREVGIYPPSRSFWFSVDWGF
jgi:TonB-linked SusC/RagA family outer membrane protein